MNEIDSTDVMLVLIGMIITVLITYLSGIGITRREAKHKTSEKIIDRKLAAYDELMVIAKSMRKIRFLEGNIDKNFPIHEKEAPVRYPIIFESVEEFNKWYMELLNIRNGSLEWLNIDATRELNFLQDYLVNINYYIESLKSKFNIKVLGCVVRQDFIDISNNLETIAFKFYTRKIFKLKIENKNRWHKYKREITNKRLNEVHMGIYKEYIDIL